MTYRVMNQKPNGKMTIHVAGGQAANINCAGNSAVSDIAVGSEVVSNVYIRKVVRGTDTNIQVKRGSNSVLILTNSGE